MNYVLDSDDQEVFFYTEDQRKNRWYKKDPLKSISHLDLIQ